MNKNRLKTVVILTNVGELKEVRFPLDDATYNAIMDSSVPKENRPYYFSLYYYDYVKESHHQRREIPFSALSKRQRKELEEKMIVDEDEARKRRQDITEVYQAIDQLTDKQKKAFLAHSQEGKSFTQIASEMGISVSGARGLYQRSIKNIRQALL